MIYVDNAGISANVTDPATGRSYNSRWCHLFSDQIDQTELHAFAKRIGMKRAWFQPGKKLGRRSEHDPVGDHYDLTTGKRQQAIAAGATPVECERAVEIRQAKRAAVHAKESPVDISDLVAGLTRETGRMGLSFNGEHWTAGLEFGKETEDSDMAGAAAYAIGATAAEAIEKVAAEAGWARPGRRTA